MEMVFISCFLHGIEQKISKEGEKVEKGEKV